MVSFHTALKFIVGHILAGATIILGTLLVTVVCYVVGLTNDPHGIDTPVAEIPLFLTLMFMAGIFAVIVSTGSFVLSTLLQWLRPKLHFPVRLPPFVVALLTFMVMLLRFGADGDVAFVALVTGMSFVYFGIYWTLLTCSAAVLDFFQRKLLSRKLI